MDNQKLTNLCCEYLEAALKEKDSEMVAAITELLKLLVVNSTSNYISNF